MVVLHFLDVPGPGFVAGHAPAQQITRAQSSGAPAQLGAPPLAALNVPRSLQPEAPRTPGSASRQRMAEDGAVQRIVVGVDGSETSKAALRWAADLARAFGVELEAVRAFRYPPALHDWDALPSN